MLDSSIIVQTDQVATIYGERGTIKILEQWNEKPDGIIVQLYNGEVAKNPCQWPGRGFQYEVEEVVKSINNKQIQSGLMNHQASINLIEMMDEIRKQIHVTYESEPYEKTSRAEN